MKLKNHAEIDNLKLPWAPGPGFKGDENNNCGATSGQRPGIKFKNYI